jgi:hypothetical protein
MKHLTIFLALLTVATVARADREPTPSQKAECHKRCFRCTVLCKQRKHPHPEACRETCLYLKRYCCETCGAGPGPRNTCSCT